MRQKRRFRDAPDGSRCKATITLRDGSRAQCGRVRKVGDYCTQHHRMYGEVQNEQVMADRVT